VGRILIYPRLQLAISILLGISHKQWIDLAIKKPKKAISIAEIENMKPIHLFP
jgi:hypothetical protein